MSKSLDLSTFDIKGAAEKGATLHLVSPFDKEPLFDDAGAPITITHLGFDSTKLRKLTREQNDKRLEKASRGQRWSAIDSLEADTVTRCIAATIGWNMLPLDGEPFPFSESNARKLYTDPRFAWIVEQLEASIGDRQRFSPTNSGS